MVMSAMLTNSITNSPVEKGFKQETEELPTGDDDVSTFSCTIKHDETVNKCFPVKSGVS